MDIDMKSQWIPGLLLSLLPLSCMAEESYFCPQNHAYIKIGMSTDEVMAACGKPLSSQESNQPIFKKIPVQQLIYNNQGTETAFYGTWNVPTGSGGTTLEVDVVNNRVGAVRVNGADSNAFSICKGADIQVGDQVGKVYGSCGSPSVINNTFIRQEVPTPEKPQVWVYQPDQYQPTITLTFVNGKLQSINN